MLDINNGVINLGDDLQIAPAFSFEQFKNTKYYNNQDGVRIIYLDKQQVIDGRKYIVGLSFRAGIIYMVSLICCDIDFSEKEEKERKLFHDAILKEYGINAPKEYDWGKIFSDYDERGDISSINIVYI